MRSLEKWLTTFDRIDWSRPDLAGFVDIQPQRSWFDVDEAIRMRRPIFEKFRGETVRKVASAAHQIQRWNFMRCVVAAGKDCIAVCLISGGSGVGPFSAVLDGFVEFDLGCK